MSLRRFLTILLVMTATMGFGAAPTWIPTERIPQSLAAELRIDNDEANVAVAEGHIYVNLEADSNVKIFTLLGQLVKEQQLPAGVHRIKLPSKGIYILKIGSLTRRIII